MLKICEFNKNVLKFKFLDKNVDPSRNFNVMKSNLKGDTNGVYFEIKKIKIYNKIIVCHILKL